ncbi:YraN family protein [Candidatus Berkelbacteria bacterium]|nr:YraN family protein [Candidatus Berkelbacteria bacterium]
MERKAVGAIGEEMAANLLKKKGHRILQRNLQTAVGEIDILTEHKRTIVLVEVKTKRGLLFGLPQEMIHHHKQHKLRQLARWLEQQYPKRTIQIDVVAINLEPDPPTIEHLENVLDG